MALILGGGLIFLASWSRASTVRDLPVTEEYSAHNLVQICSSCLVNNLRCSSVSRVMALIDITRSIILQSSMFLIRIAVLCRQLLGNWTRQTRQKPSPCRSCLAAWLTSIQKQMFKESLLLRSPSFYKEISRDTKPLTEKAERLGLTPLLRRCLRMVFSDMPSLAMADSTIQMEVDFRAKVFPSNSLVSSLRITMLTCPSCSCSSRMALICWQILVASSTRDGLEFLDKHHNSNAVSQKVRDFSSLITFCNSLPDSSAFDPMVDSALSMLTFDCSLNLPKLPSIFCSKLSHLWSDSLNRLVDSRSKKFSSYLGASVSLRLQQSLKIGWAYDQVL